jgi:transposase InsO family protein
MIVSDNGTEVNSHASLTWVKDQRIEWHYIMPGMPMQKVYVESVSGRMRDELLDETLCPYPRTDLGEGRCVG